VNELPSGVVGLIIAGLFAAAMGALSSAINAIAAIVVTDFQPWIQPDASPGEQVRLARQATLACGSVATAVAAWLAWRNVASLWDEFLRLTALIGGGFPGVFLLGLLTRRANSPGVILGVIASIAVTWWVQTHTSTNPFLYVFVAITSCAAIGYAASWAFAARTPTKSLRGLTLWDQN
jgi:Na+/proline symporter